MRDQLKIGDVVMIKCACENCQRFGAPDPSKENGPFIIDEIKDGGVRARVPFGRGEIRFWPPHVPVAFEVVGRA